MKLAHAFIVVTLCVSAESFAGGRNKSQPRFTKKTCGDGQDPKVCHARMNDQFRQTNEEQRTQKAMRAAQIRLAGIKAVIPEWCSLMPETILLFVDFDQNDPLIKRAYKFLKLGLLVRDMYQPLPLNERILMTWPTMVDDQLPHEVHMKVVGLALLEAYTLLDAHRINTESRLEDDLASQLEVGYWATYYSRLGKNKSREYKAILEQMHEFAKTVLVEDFRPKVREFAKALFTATGTISQNMLEAALKALV